MVLAKYFIFDSKSVIPGIPQVEGNTVKLPLAVELCYRGADGMLGMTRRSFLQRFSTAIEEGQSLSVDAVFAQELLINPSSDGAELRLPLELRTFLWETERVEHITALALEEGQTLDLSEEPTLVLFRVTDKDDLWRIAKENHSTLAAISECNDLGSLAPGWEKLLLIPKTI